MITFLDGPARGQSLTLRWAPLYLRVVRDAAGKWDALDQPDDVPVATFYEPLQWPREEDRL